MGNKWVNIFNQLSVSYTHLNVNASYFYYVLRPSKPDDGREQHSFDYLDQDVRIYNDWTPGQFQSNTIDDNSEVIKRCV